MIKLALGLAVVLILIILLLIFRVQVLVSIMRGTYRKRAGSSNKVNAALMMLFFIAGVILFFWYSDVAEKNYLGEAASKHGVMTDKLFWITTYITVVIFVVTNFFLFYFSYKYQHQEGKEAYFYPHNNKLELVWTVIPAIVLSLLVFFGWRTWTNIMSPVKGGDDVVVVEVLGKQFNWQVRYPGQDGELGDYDYTLINDTRNNTFGIDVTDQASFDDFTPREIHLPEGKKVLFKIRSRDVLHSVYVPHFRLKMDAVPGMPTTFSFTPTKTTEEMRTETGNADFNYEMACAEVCGRGHFGMRYTVVVEEEEEFKKWKEEQKPWIAQNPGYLKDVPKDMRAEAIKVIKKHNPKGLAKVLEEMGDKDKAMAMQKTSKKEKAADTSAATSKAVADTLQAPEADTVAQASEAARAKDTVKAPAAAPGAQETAPADTAAKEAPDAAAEEAGTGAEEPAAEETTEGQPAGADTTESGEPNSSE